MLSTDKAWEKFGRQAPYFGVLAHEKFAADRIHENRDEFFATGRGFVSQLLERSEPIARGRGRCGGRAITSPA